MTPIFRRQIFFGFSIALTAIGLWLFQTRSVFAQATMNQCCCTADLNFCMDAAPTGFIRSCPPAGVMFNAYTEYRIIEEVFFEQFPSCTAYKPLLLENPKKSSQTQSGNQPDQQPRKSWVSAVVCPGRPDEDCEIIPKQCRVEDKAKPCTINDLLSILVRLSKLMLGVLGTAAFAMFIYGGFVFLLSQGNQERVAKGKSILLNAVIGILVVFISWSLVNFVVNAFSAGRSGLGGTGSVFSNQWDRGP